LFVDKSLDQSFFLNFLVSLFHLFLSSIFD
jgi:hypothetical protein